MAVLVVMGIHESPLSLKKSFCILFYLILCFFLALKKKHEVLTSNQTKAQFLNVRGLVYLEGDTRRNRWGLN